MKRFFLILLCFTLVLTWAGCGQTGNPSAEPDVSGSAPESETDSSEVSLPTPEEELKAAAEATGVRFLPLSASETDPSKTPSLKDIHSVRAKLEVGKLILGEYDLGKGDWNLGFDTDDSKNVSMTVDGKIGEKPFSLLYQYIDKYFYVMLDGVMEKPVRFSMDEFVNSFEDVTEILPFMSKIPVGGDQNQLTDLLDGFRTKLQQIPLEKTVSENGDTVFSRTVGEDVWNEFAQQIRDALSQLTDDPGESGDESRSSDVSDVSASEKTDLSAINELEQSFTVRDGLVREGSIKFRDKAGNVQYILHGDIEITEKTNSFTCALHHQDECLMEGTAEFKPEDGATGSRQMKAKLEFPTAGGAVALTVRTKSESDAKTTYNGSLEITTEQNGLKVTIPVKFDGEIRKEDADSPTTFVFHPQLKVGEMLDTDFALTLTLSSALPKLTPPEDAKPLEKGKHEEFAKNVFEHFPELASIAALFGGGTGIAQRSFQTDDNDLFVSFDSASQTVALAALCDYQDNGKELTLRRGKNTYKVPYKPEGDAVSILGYSAVVYKDTENNVTSLYDEESGSWMDLYPDGYATVTVITPWDGKTDVLTLTFPDGTEYSWDLEWTLDETSFTMVSGGPVLHEIDTDITEA